MTGQHPSEKLLFVFYRIIKTKNGAVVRIPKLFFLTDGFATDLDNGFLWFKGNVPEFNTALEEYSKLGISISTVGLDPLINSL